MAMSAREYYLANRERILARVKARAAEKREEIRAYKSEWHAKNRAEILAKKRVYHAGRREAVNAAQRDKYSIDPSHAANMKARAKAYRKANPAKAYAAVAAWCEANRERLRKVKRDYSRKRPELGRIGRANRRARVAAAFVEPVDYREVLKESGGVCGICKKPLDLFGVHFDHIVPLARGGKHERVNIQAAHASCNLVKGAKLQREMSAWL